MDPMIWDLLKTFLSCGLSFALGIIASFLARRRTREDKAIEEQRANDKKLLDQQEANNMGTLALCRKAVIDAYDTFVINGTPMSVERHNEIDKLYEAYHALGGNGTISRYYEEIANQPTYIVSDHGKEENENQD